MNPTHEQIAKKAYEIWLNSGKPESQNKLHWQQAEQALKKSVPAAQKPEAGSKPKPAPKKSPAPKRKSA